MAVMFAKQDRSEPDSRIQEGGWTGLSEGLLRTQVLELLSCSDTKGQKDIVFCI